MAKRVAAIKVKPGVQRPPSTSTTPRGAKSALKGAIRGARAERKRVR